MGSMLQNFCVALRCELFLLTVGVAADPTPRQYKEYMERRKKGLEERLDEAEAMVRRHLYRASCGGQPVSCRPDERVRHYLMPYLDQIRLAEVPVS